MCLAGEKAAPDSAPLEVMPTEKMARLSSFPAGARQCQFPDTLHHVGDDAFDDAFRERSVVKRHVFSQLFDVLGFVDHRAGIESAIACRFLVFVLVNLVV